MHLEMVGREQGLHEVVLNTKIQNCLKNADLVTLLPWHMHTASLASSFFHLVWYCASFLHGASVSWGHSKLPSKICTIHWYNNANLNISPFWARADALRFCTKDFIQYCFSFFVPWILCQIIDLQNYKGERLDKSSNCSLYRCPKCGPLCTVFKIHPESLSSPITYCLTQALLRGSRGGRVGTLGQHQHPNCMAASVLALILCHLTDTSNTMS